MIVTNDTKELIQQYIDRYVPEGIDEWYHIDRQRHMFDIVEVLIEKDIIEPDPIDIKETCKNWDGMLFKKFGLLN